MDVCEGGATTDARPADVPRRGVPSTGAPSTGAPSTGAPGTGVTFRFRGDLDADPPEVAQLWERGCLGVVQEGDELVAYFDAPVPLPVEGRWEAPPARDFVREYLDGLEPVDLGPLVVAPTHRSVVLAAGQRPLWLDPGMAFGTGHHETTRLALEALADALSDRPVGTARVLDLGAGSGILAVAADLLGAAEARGLDTDPATVPIARENAALNRSRAVFSVGTLGGTDAPTEGVDVLVANLYAEIHHGLIDAYLAALAPGGVLLLTGVLARLAPPLAAALADAGLGVSRREAGEWVLFEGRR